MKPEFTVLIIGAGSIGAGFDNPVSKEILTHAHAFTKHKGFKLIGFVDSEIEKAKRAVSIWGGKAFENLEEAFNSSRIDLAVVAVPDDFHYRILKELSRFPVKLIFAEKPITKTISEAKEILRIYNNKDIGIAVNYTRRFVPEFEKIKKGISEGAYGEYLTGTGYYGKGIIHNGSHLIDLLRFFIGEIKDVKPASNLADFYEDDNSISAVLAFENGKKFFLQYLDCKKFTMFELDLLFERKRIRVVDLGFKVEEYDVQDSKIFSGYRNIAKTAEYDTSLQNALYNAAENIYMNLTEGQSLKCTAEDGYKALKTCMEIKESVI